MFESWEFYKGTDDKWRWRRSDDRRSGIAESCVGFETRTACIVDAMKNGYLSFSATQPDRSTRGETPS